MTLYRWKIAPQLESAIQKTVKVCNIGLDRIANEKDISESIIL